MVMSPGIQTVETYQDRKILAFIGFAGPIISVVLAANQGDLVAGTVLGKNAATESYEKYVPAVAATLDVGVKDDNNAITFTAKKAGAAANGIKITMIGTGTSQPLEVRLVNNEIRIQLKTSAVPAIMSTAAEVIAAVNASLLAKDLVVAANTGTSDGTAVVTAAEATALAAGADSNVVPSVILGENVPNQAAAANVEAYLGGVFYTNKLVGMDALAAADLNARAVDTVTIVPV